MSMNFYAQSVALLWTTAMRLGVPDTGRPGKQRVTDPLDEVHPAALGRALPQRVEGCRPVSCDGEQPKSRLSLGNRSSR